MAPAETPDDLVATYKERVIISSGKRLMWGWCVACCWAAPRLYSIISLRTLLLHQALPVLVLVSSSVPAFLVSIHPSTHLAGVRRDGPSGAEWNEGWSDSWSPVRQGETNYPTNENHSSSLHLSSLPSSTPPSEILHTWEVTPEKNPQKLKPPPPQLYSPCCSLSVVTHAATAISALFY